MSDEAAAAIAAAMMADLGIGRHEDLPLENNPSKAQNYYPRPIREPPPGAMKANSGWGTLADHGLDDGEAEASRALGDLGGGRLHAAAQASMRNLFSNVQQSAQERQPVSNRRPPVPAASTTNYGILERAGVPTRRFGSHPNTQTSCPPTQTTALAPRATGPSPQSGAAQLQAPPRSAPAPAATRLPPVSPGPGSASVAAKFLQGTAGQQQVLTQPDSVVTFPPETTQRADPREKVQQPSVRLGLTWRPARPPAKGTYVSEGTGDTTVAQDQAFTSSETVSTEIPPASDNAATSIQMLADTVTVSRPQPSEGPQSDMVSPGLAKQQPSEEEKEKILKKEKDSVSPPSSGSITILKSNSPCRVTAVSGQAPVSSPGDFTMKLVQKGAEIIATLTFKLRNGTSTRFDWQNLVGVDLEIPNKPLTVGLTFANGEAENVVYTISLVSMDRVKKLKDKLHTIHEIWSLERFMAGREDEIMKIVDDAEITCRNDKDEIAKVKLGLSITARAAESMAENLGIPVAALTPKMRNIMRASFIRMALKNFDKMAAAASAQESEVQDDELTGGDDVPRESASRGNPPPTLEQFAPSVTVKEEKITESSGNQITDIAAKVEKDTSVLPKDLAPVVVVMNEKEGTAAPVDGLDIDIGLEVGTVETSAPADNPVSDVVIKEGKLIELAVDEAVEIPSTPRQPAGSRVVVTTTSETHREGRLVRKEVTVMEYVYDT